MYGVLQRLNPEPVACMQVGIRLFPGEAAGRFVLKETSCLHMFVFTTGVL